jgi:hypothetical protein
MPFAATKKRFAVLAGLYPHCNISHPKPGFKTREEELGNTLIKKAQSQETQ